MKKILFFVITVTIFGLTSCKKDEVTPEVKKNIPIVVQHGDRVLGKWD